MTKRTGPGRDRSKGMKLEKAPWEENSERLRQGAQTQQHQRGTEGVRDPELKPGLFYKLTAEPADRWK